MFANALVYTLLLFWIIFACNPREAIWNWEVKGECLNPNANSVVSAVWNLVSDVMIFTLPIGRVWKLQMSVDKKVGISAIFAVGAM